MKENFFDQKCCYSSH